GRAAAFRPGQQSTRYPNAPLGLVYPGDSSVPDGAFPRSLNYFSPRLGIAWQPKALPNTSIRAAFGIFTAPIDSSSYNHTPDNPPFSPSYNFSVSQGYKIDFADPWANYTPLGGKSPFPPFATPDNVPPSSVQFLLPATFQAGFSNDFVLARDQTWNF